MEKNKLATVLDHEIKECERLIEQIGQTDDPVLLRVLEYLRIIIARRQKMIEAITLNESKE